MPHVSLPAAVQPYFERYPAVVGVQIHPDDMNARAWSHFLLWLLKEKTEPALIRETFDSACKAWVYLGYENFQMLEKPELIECLFGDQIKYIKLLGTHIKTVQDLMHFTVNYDWHAAGLDDKIIDAIKNNEIRPTYWLLPLLEGVGEVSDRAIQLIAAHWEATDAPFGEWRKAGMLLLGIEPNHDAPDIASYPEVMLLMDIAQRKMREIIRADRTFLHITVT